MRKSKIDELASQLKTPKQVQRFLKTLPYNREMRGATQRSAERALRAGEAHCFEGVFIAAAILEKNGYPPLVLSFESQDGLDHVIFVFRENGKWGSVAQSRDYGLCGRAPVYRSIRDLAWSYFDPYVDRTGRITAYQLVNLNDTNANWRTGQKNVFKAEKYLLDLAHRPLKSSNRRYKRLLRNYLRRGPLPRRKYWW